MNPNYYGQPFHHYGRFRHHGGPSRIKWFIFGGAAFAIWQYMHKTEAERRRFFGWCRERQLTGRDDHDYATEARRGRRGETSSMANQKAGLEAGSTREDARRNDGWESEPLWKLRSEKEAERSRSIKDIEVREQLLNAREKVLSATESGLESLRQSLESLTKMVQEQRKESSSRDQSASTDREKKD